MKTNSPRSPQLRKATVRASAAFRRDQSSALLENMIPQTLSLKQILVPIDFSKIASKALQYAVPLAIEHGSCITLVHVSELPKLTPGIEYIGISSAETARLEQQLAELAEASLPRDVAFKTVVKCGNGPESIIAAARDMGADMIILTTHGYTGLKHVLMGSTAEQVVRRAPCSVLVVR
jgi:nucleotide-binding universal stress UspA family protein